MSTKKVLGAATVAAIAVAMFFSVASATRPCAGKSKPCNDECVAACNGATSGPCCRRVKAHCRKTTCTCDGTGTPCGSPSGAFLE